MILTIAAAIAALASLVISLGYHILIYFKARSSKDSWIVNPKASQAGGSGNGKVRITIVVPTKNEPLDLLVEATKVRAQALTSAKHCSGNVLIVSDDGEGYVRKLRRALHSEISSGIVKVLRRERPVGGRSGALDHGAKVADGEYVMILDSDSKISAETLDSVCLAASELKPPAIIAPWRGYAREPGRVSEAMIFSTDTVSHLLYRMRGKAGFFVFPLGSGTAIRKDVLEEVGYWGPNIIQDDIWLGTKLALRGYFPVVLGKGETEVLVPSRLRALRIQQSRWAYGASEVLSRTLYSILARAKMSLGRRLEMILYMLQPALTLLILIAALLAFAAAVLEPGWGFWRALHSPALIAIALVAEALIVAYVALQLKLSDKTGWITDGASLWKSLVQLGRAAAMLGVLIPVMGIHSLRGLLRLRYRYIITPKQGSSVGRDWLPYAMLAASTAGTALALLSNNIVSLTILLPFLIVSAYSSVRIE